MKPRGRFKLCKRRCFFTQSISHPSHSVSGLFCLQMMKEGRNVQCITESGPIIPSKFIQNDLSKMHLRTGQVPISGVISGKQLYTCLQVSRNHCHITLTYRLQVFKRISLNLAGLFITENQSYLTRALTKKLNNRPCQRKVYFCCQPLVFSLLVPDFSYWHLKCP